MASQEAKVANFAGKKCFATISFCKAYWQRTSGKHSRDACGMISPQETVDPTRVLRGLRKRYNTFSGARVSMLSIDATGLYVVARRFFHKRREDRGSDPTRGRIFQHLYRAQFENFGKKGQIYSENNKMVWENNIWPSFKLKPKNKEAIKNMDYSTTADELCQFIYCCWWTSNCIPGFRYISKP